MAQDVATSPREIGLARPLWRSLARLRSIQLLPPTAPLARVVLTPPLVAYVAIVSAIGIAVGILTIRWLSYDDPATLVAGSVATFLMALFTVKSLTQTPFVFSPSVFVNLGLSVTFGPIGAAAAALSEAIGVARRTRNGWFRTVFNIFNHFLSNVSAYGAFLGVTTLAGHEPGTGAYLVAGLAAGVTQHVVNHTLMTGVIRTSNPAVNLRDVVLNGVGVLPYSIGYGLAAFTFVKMQATAQVGGFMALLLPMILLQGYLILFARRVQAHEEERAAHQQERERLLPEGGRGIGDGAAENRARSPRWRRPEPRRYGVRALRRGHRNSRHRRMR